MYHVEGFQEAARTGSCDLTASCKHHTITTWKRAIFPHCHFLSACSLFTQRFPIMKTADQRNWVFTGLKTQINETLVPYPSSETPLNLCSTTTFQWISYILNINSIVPSPNRQIWPLTATPTIKKPYIFYKPTLFHPFPKLPVPTSYLPSKPSYPLINCLSSSLQRMEPTDKFQHLQWELCFPILFLIWTDWRHSGIYSSLSDVLKGFILFFKQV